MLLADEFVSYRKMLAASRPIDLPAGRVLVITRAHRMIVNIRFTGVHLWWRRGPVSTFGIGGLGGRLWRCWGPPGFGALPSCF